MPARSLAIGILSLLTFSVMSSCGADGRSSDEITADSAHAEIIADLHLADARAEITGEPADSLRDAALAIHALDSTAMFEVLDAYARDPEQAVALYERANEQLTEEQRGR